jgi:crotonobetainyl-CoA:carnitine CoA-transferase CaiB-like acyl-CoA transferase
VTTQTSAPAPFRQEATPGPLAGLRVIELGDRIGQWCGKLMADFGAEVIKIEPPGGSAERKIGPFYKDVEDPNRSLHFWHYNTSKKGITLNIEQPEGRNLFKRLVETADILLETTKPGTLPAMGLTYEALSANNPRLIMCSLTDFGQDGPWRDWLATDMLHLAGGGQMAGSGYDAVDDEEQRPIAPGGGQGFHMGCHFAYIGIMAALHYRNMTGQGQYIDSSAHEAAALTTEMHVPNWIYAHNVVKRQTGRHAGVRPSAPSQMPTGDGRWINMGGGLSTSFRAFIEVMAEAGMAGDLQDEKYLDPEVMMENQDHIRELVRAYVATVPADGPFKAAQEIAGLPWGIVRAPDDLPDDEHFQQRGFFLQVEHPELGETFTYPGAGAVYSASPQRIYRRAPLIGEDNASVYGALGVDAEQLAKLKAAGTV